MRDTFSISIGGEGPLSVTGPLKLAALVLAEKYETSAIHAMHSSFLHTGAYDRTPSQERFGEQKEGQQWQ